MNLSEIKTKSISDLIDIATDLGIEDVGRLKKQDIIFRIFKQFLVYWTINYSFYRIRSCKCTKSNKQLVKCLNID